MPETQLAAPNSYPHLLGLLVPECCPKQATKRSMNLHSALIPSEDLHLQMLLPLSLLPTLYKMQFPSLAILKVSMS